MSPFMLMLACSSPSPVPAANDIEGCYGVAGRPLFSLVDGQMHRATDGLGVATYNRQSDENGTRLRFTPGFTFSRQGDNILIGRSPEPKIHLPISVVGDRLRILIPVDPDFGVAEASRISITGC